MDGAVIRYLLIKTTEPLIRFLTPDCSVNLTTERKSQRGSKLFSVTGNSKSSWKVPNPVEMYCQVSYRVQYLKTLDKIYN